VVGQVKVDIGRREGSGLSKCWLKKKNIGWEREEKKCDPHRRREVYDQKMLVVERTATVFGIFSSAGEGNNQDSL